MKNLNKVIKKVISQAAQRINKNGDIELYVMDTYDFNKGEKSGAPAVGRDRQEKGEIKPYFEIYHVIIPKEKYDKIRSK